MPSRWSSRAVPPVDTISTPSSLSPRAKSTSPRLSLTVRSARRTRTSSGAVTSTPVPSLVATSISSLYDNPARRRRVDAHRTRGDQPDRPRQKLVLDGVNPRLDCADVESIRIDLESLLRDDRPGVDALVDEVDGHAHHAHPVVERLLDRVEPRERRQERRVHIDQPPRVVLHELRRE